MVHVLATAGHVDHGKSTLVRALTGMEPDRWAEERRRGMTIDLGFAWTRLPSGTQVAFVDVPGHERFVANMLAGVGAVPAVMFVVAADEGWMPQSAEHLDAVDALGIRHGLLVVTRSDLADPAPALARAGKEIAATSLGQLGAVAVAVSGRTGAGLAALRTALDRLVGGLPVADPHADVRFWIDRAFTIRGAGTVVTGTLGAGCLRVGEELQLAPAMRTVQVRGLHCLGEPVQRAVGVSRVAVNLRGVPVEEVHRGFALLTPAHWLLAEWIDVRLHGAASGDLPRTCTLHMGSADVAVRIRPLGADVCRLRLAAALPLRIGDRALLRDPGRRRIAAGLTVLDVRPPALRRRGAAAARAEVLAGMGDQPDGEAELSRRLIIRAGDMLVMGATPPAEPVVGDWLVEPGAWSRLRARLEHVVAEHAEHNPLEHGLPVEAARQLLDLPDVALAVALVQPPLHLAGGRISLAPATLPPGVARAVATLEAELAERPYAAPDARRLAELGLGSRELAAAVRIGVLARVGDGIYLLPAALTSVTDVLATLPQPFTVSAVRAALGTTRRVAVPLLELLDVRGQTRRLPDSRRELVR